MNVEWVTKNGSNFRMCSNLGSHQLKIDCYKDSLVYIKHMVTTNQNSTKRDKKNKQKGIQTQRYRKPSTREESKRTKKEQRTINTMKQLKK